MLQTIGLLALCFVCYKLFRVFPKSKLSIVKFEEDEYTIEWKFGPIHRYRSQRYDSWYWRSESGFATRCVGSLEQCQNHHTWKYRNNPEPTDGN